MEEKNQGITLIALIITIIIMLILVAVSISLALNSGLFKSAGKASHDWQTAQDAEQEIAEGKIQIGNGIYDIENYVGTLTSNWEYDAATGTILKYIGEDINELETLVIPSQINGTKIKSIAPVQGDSWWPAHTIVGECVGDENPNGINIKNIIIEEGIEVIDTYAFSYMNMVNVKLPSTIKAIKEAAFWECKKLETINFPEGLEKIEGWGAFDECVKLNNITLPSTLTEIGEEAFYDCYSLEYVYIPKNLTNVDPKAFMSGCAYIDVDPENEVYKSIDGVFFTKDGKTLLTYCAGNARTEYTVPNGTESIGNLAFDSSEKLVTINIPSSVQTIESQAFWRTYALKTINIDRSENAISGSKWYAGNKFGVQSNATVTVNWNGDT